MAKLERDVEQIGNLPYALPQNIEKIPTPCNFGNTRQGRGEMRTESSMAKMNVKELAQEFALSEQDLIVQSLRAFVIEQLDFSRQKNKARCAKFGVVSLEEMESLIVEGAVEEQDILDDFQNVDYLTTRIERMEHLLETF
ncbi:MAG: hypothetical protein KKC18_01800 [Chloroflexi bacterium]|nr:hypothetical protein [Chloroflexota bacterium]